MKKTLIILGLVYAIFIINFSSAVDVFNCSGASSLDISSSGVYHVRNNFTAIQDPCVIISEQNVSFNGNRFTINSSADHTGTIVLGDFVNEVKFTKNIRFYNITIKDGINLLQLYYRLNHSLIENVSLFNAVQYGVDQFYADAQSNNITFRNILIDNATRGFSLSATNGEAGISFLNGYSISNISIFNTLEEAIFISNMNRSNLVNMTLRGDGSVTNGNLYLENIFLSNISRINIFNTNNSNNGLVYLFTSQRSLPNNVFNNITIKNASIGISLISSNITRFNNIDIYNPSQYWIFSQNVKSNIFTNLTFANPNISVGFVNSSSINITGTKNISTYDLNITEDSIYFNVTKFPEFNKTAIITIYNTPDGTLEAWAGASVCGDCITISNSGGIGVIKFTNWTNEEYTFVISQGFQGGGESLSNPDGFLFSILEESGAGIALLLRFISPPLAIFIIAVSLAGILSIILKSITNKIKS